jgi:hypothetical protein
MRPQCSTATETVRYLKLILSIVFLLPSVWLLNSQSSIRDHGDKDDFGTRSNFICVPLGTPCGCSRYSYVFSICNIDEWHIQRKIRFRMGTGPILGHTVCHSAVGAASICATKIFEYQLSGYSRCYKIWIFLLPVWIKFQPLRGLSELEWQALATPTRAYF